MTSKEDRKGYLELDTKDRAILSELSSDASQTMAEMSRKTKISKQVLGYRIKDLITAKKFEAHTVINLSGFGYELYDILIEYKTMPDEKKLRNLLDEHKSVVGYSFCIGAHDLQIRVWAKDQAEVKKIIHDIDSTLRFIGGKKILLVEQVSNHGRKYLEDKNEIKQVLFKRGNEELDEKDAKILKHISKNPRITTKELADKVKMSQNTVSARIKTLKKKDIIGCTSTKIKGAKKTVQYLQVVGNEERMRALESYLTNNRYVTATCKCSGQYDIAITTEAPNKERRTILLDIRSMFSDIITRHDLIEVSEEHKNNYVPW